MTMVCGDHVISTHSDTYCDVAEVTAIAAADIVHDLLSVMMVEEVTKSMLFSNPEQSRSSTGTVTKDEL
jgi:hypothetical protein